MATLNLQKRTERASSMDWLQRVIAAALNHAQYTLLNAAAPTAGNEEKFAKRANFARAVIASPDEYVRKIALLVSANTPDEPATDTVIEGKIQTLWDALSGVDKSTA